MKNNKLFWDVLWILILLAALPTQQAATQSIPTISILSPTQDSTLSSPIHMQVELGPDAGPSIRVSLINGSNFTIARQLSRIQINQGSATSFETWLPFEIPIGTRKALLTVSTVDEYNRPQSLRSVFLTLTSISTDEVLPYQPTDKGWLTINSPSPSDQISGGTFQINGTVIPLTAEPVYFELITDSGGVIGNAFLYIKTPGEPVSFDLPITYNFIGRPRDVRMVVRQASDDYQAPIILDSLLLTLAP